MRHFYTHHSIPPVTAELDWIDYVDLMPVRDEKKRKHLELSPLRAKVKEGYVLIDRSFL